MKFSPCFSGFFTALFLTLFAISAVQAADAPAPTTDNKTTAETTSTTNPVSIEDVQRFGAALQIVKSYYVEPIPDQKLFENAIRGMLSGLDPHSDYLDAEDLKELQGMTTGEFSGIGIEIIPQDSYLKVVTPLDGSPASKAGIKPGDIILRINDQLVKDMSVREAVQKMRGAKGSELTLTIVRKGEQAPLKIKVIRDNIVVKSVTSKMLKDNYGYVRISSFQTNTAKSLEEAVANLNKQAGGQLKGLVLDLRNNPGGLLDSATTVADDFLEPARMGKNKLITFTKSRIPDSQISMYATPGDITNNAPMVVLINGGSASGAEIVAGALQDHHRALVVGTSSFGKGSVQTVIPLDQTTAIKLTTALYFTPSGRSIQATSIKPDVTVEDMKLASAKKPDELISIKEADLKGHLANGNAPKEGAAPAAAANSNSNPPPVDKLQAASESDDLVSADYQLYEGLNLLKAMTVMHAMDKS